MIEITIGRSLYMAH